MYEESEFSIKAPCGESTGFVNRFTLLMSSLWEFAGGGQHHQWILTSHCAGMTLNLLTVSCCYKLRPHSQKKNTSALFEFPPANKVTSNYFWSFYVAKFTFYVVQQYTSVFTEDTSLSLFNYTFTSLRFPENVSHLLAFSLIWLCGKIQNTKCHECHVRNTKPAHCNNEWVQMDFPFKYKHISWHILRKTYP